MSSGRPARAKRPRASAPIDVARRSSPMPESPHSEETDDCETCDRRQQSCSGYRRARDRQRLWNRRCHRHRDLVKPDCTTARIMGATRKIEQPSYSKRVDPCCRRRAANIPGLVINRETRGQTVDVHRIRPAPGHTARGNRETRIRSPYRCVRQGRVYLSDRNGSEQKTHSKRPTAEHSNVFSATHHNTSRYGQP